MAKKSAAKPVESAEVVDLRQQVEYWKARAEAAEEGMRTTTRALLASQRRYVEEVVRAATEGETLGESRKRSYAMQAETPKPFLIPRDPESNFSATVQDANAAAWKRREPRFVLNETVRIVGPSHPFRGADGVIMVVRSTFNDVLSCDVRLQGGNIVTVKAHELDRL